MTMKVTANLELPILLFSLALLAMSLFAFVVLISHFSSYLEVKFNFLKSRLFYYLCGAISFLAIGVVTFLQFDKSEINWLFEILAFLATSFISLINQYIYEAHKYRRDELSKDQCAKEIANLNEEVKSLRSSEKIHLVLSKATRAMVAKKIHRLNTLFAETKCPGKVKLGKALTPSAHLHKLLEKLAGAIITIKGKDPHTVECRLAIYYDDKGVARTIPGLSLSTLEPETKPIEAPAVGERENEVFYTKESKQQANICKSIYSKENTVVPNCEEADLARGFFYTNESQKKYLKSLLTVYIGRIPCAENDDLVASGLSIDCNEFGFFSQGDLETLKDVIDEFRIRFKLELYLKFFFEANRKQRRTGNGRKGKGPETSPEQEVP